MTISDLEVSVENGRQMGFRGPSDCYPCPGVSPAPVRSIVYGIQTYGYGSTVFIDVRAALSDFVVMFSASNLGLELGQGIVI